MAKAHRSEQVNMRLSHLTSDGEAHMVHIPSTKPDTPRRAIARATLRFSNPTAYRLIRSTYSTSSSSAEETLKKGDVVAVARIAGIMGAKKTADLVPLCHNIPLSGVSVDVDVVNGGSGRLKGKTRWGVQDGGSSVMDPPKVDVSQGQASSTMDFCEPSEEDIGPYGAIVITASAQTHGQTGVEMEAMTAATVAALTAYDMCKAVDKAMVISGARVVLKEGGKSGRWVEGKQTQS